LTPRRSFLLGFPEDIARNGVAFRPRDRYIKTTRLLHIIFTLCVRPGFQAFRRLDRPRRVRAEPHLAPRERVASGSRKGSDLRPHPFALAPHSHGAMNTNEAHPTPSPEDACDSTFLACTVLGTVAGAISSTLCSAPLLDGAYTEALAVAGAALGGTVFGALG